MEQASCRPIAQIVGARILSQGWQSDQQYDISVDGPSVNKISLHNHDARIDANAIDARGCLIGPSLCHAHIHLDKCFLLNDPKYADLEIVKGDFAEALEMTSKAKSRFEEDDLLRRGRWLIEESISAGVTHMRVFVEVDVTVDLKCHSVALKLKEQFQDACYLQICVFAQDPIFSTENCRMNRELLLEALSVPEVEVLGTTPYVEDSVQNTSRNLEWAMQIALTYNKHLDLHLDYNLEAWRNCWVLEAVRCAERFSWPRHNGCRTISLGHCTRMTLFDYKKLRELAESIKDLPISFVGLPTSDLFMMGKFQSWQERVRGTLQIPNLIQEYNITGAISINNVGNAFTPYGSCDPLSVATMGVGIYQAGTKQDARILYECVSTRAKKVIGTDHRGEPFEVGKPADFVIFGHSEDMKKGRRGRGSVQEIVYDPPRERRTIYRGRLVEI